MNETKAEENCTGARPACTKNSGILPHSSDPDFVVASWSAEAVQLHANRPVDQDEPHRIASSNGLREVAPPQHLTVATKSLIEGLTHPVAARRPWIKMKFSRPPHDLTKFLKPRLI
jgi:hypothetical protein